MAEIANVCLKLSSRAENVLVVRQALTGLAELLGLDAVEANDLATAVTEACNNAVLHAYGDGEEGPLEVEVCALGATIVVIVRDRGQGIGEHAIEGRGGEAGIGLPVMRALSQRVDFREPPGGGTEVRLEFDAPKARSVEPVSEEWRPPAAAEAALAGSVEMTLAPSSVARSVLPRVLSALAARAYFSTDRIGDVQMVADTLVDDAHDALVGSHLGVAVELAPRDLELRVGPLVPGRAQEILDSSVASDPVLGRLTDAQQVSAADSKAEILELRMLERR